ncbi:MAG: ribonuclease P protein subunit [Candidatus Thermoplasmatota archaeon]|jgi:RNase P/RNase MRP subunit p29|nr:ribonuclease P [Euryarchaeota archaeon]MDP6489462.1 ribonuclease P protein subunit [Candidatus Poseidoniia archaeon]MEC7930111.1 ribonuclease P protein subunit [Candidatus Thermoplasmatota archaeon]MDP6534152.1 ribonuclease P protein subunit [Candidatus Poseidoniia archaeon]MDP6835362.1 ribonuclease P protein subunit [Candidatus Poseidoniia archaeon]|tara:strand:- start:76 stop:318 length:243 start_codon:yes stop_codon:yes gene_type:complete
MSLAQQEFIGQRVIVAEHSDPSLRGIAGKIVDETRETLFIETESGRKRVTKRNGNFSFDGKNVVGDRIAFRAQDRTRRCA